MRLWVICIVRCSGCLCMPHRSCYNNSSSSNCQSNLTNHHASSNCLCGINSNSTAPPLPTHGAWFGSPMSSVCCVGRLSWPTHPAQHVGGVHQRALRGKRLLWISKGNKICTKWDPWDPWATWCDRRAMPGASGIAMRCHVLWGSTWGQPLWDDDEWSEKSYGMEWHKEQLQKHNGTGIVMATSKWWATLQRCQRLQTCISQLVVDANKNEVRVIQECPRIRFEN